MLCQASPVALLRTERGVRDLGARPGHQGLPGGRAPWRSAWALELDQPGLSPGKHLFPPGAQGGTHILGCAVKPMAWGWGGGRGEGESKNADGLAGA